MKGEVEDVQTLKVMSVAKVEFRVLYRLPVMRYIVQKSFGDNWKMLKEVALWLTFVKSQELGLGWPRWRRWWHIVQLIVSHWIPANTFVFDCCCKTRVHVGGEPPLRLESFQKSH